MSNLWDELVIEKGPIEQLLDQYAEDFNTRPDLKIKAKTVLSYHKNDKHTTSLLQFFILKANDPNSLVELFRISLNSDLEISGLFLTQLRPIKTSNNGDSGLSANQHFNSIEELDQIIKDHIKQNSEWRNQINILNRIQ